MFNEYKKKFIFLNMLSIGAVIFAVLCVLFVYQYYANISSLENTMEQMLTPVSSSEQGMQASKPSVQGSEPPQVNEPAHGDEPIQGSEPAHGDEPIQGSEPAQGNAPAPNDEKKEPPSNDAKKTEPDEIKDNRSISVIFYKPGDGSLSLLSSSIITDEDELSSIAAQISQNDSGFGSLSSPQLYYCLQKTRSENKIAIAYKSYIWSKMAELGAVLALVFIGAMGVFYLISKRFSAIAVKPLEIAVTREKQFIADISHDLKTPVAVILANIDIIKKNNYTSGEELNKWLDSAQNAAHNIRHLTEEMLELAEMDFSEKKPVITDVNISDAAQRATLFMESVAYEREIEYVCNIEDNIIVQANEDSVEKIFSSLTDNALKYEKKGGKITIDLYKAGDKAIFKVNNKSTFISDEDLPHIFERFYRADKSRKNNGSFGLGLAIVKKNSRPYKR